MNRVENMKLVRGLGMAFLILMLALLPAMISIGKVRGAQETGKETAEQSTNKAPVEKAESPYSKNDLSFRIAIDPGHGGIDSGAYGFGMNEKTLTLKVAKLLKEELEKYDNVEVFLTRTKDESVKKHRRTTMAVEKKADLLVSIHFDAYDPACLYDSGSSAIVPRIGSWHTGEARESNKLARSILQCLEDLGLRNHGVIRRKSTIGETYQDGSSADYYAIVRNGMRKNLPSVLIEGAFIDNKKDFYNYLSDGEKRRTMAKADAEGIARYLQLARKSDGSIPKPVVRKGKKLVLKANRNSYFSMSRKAYYLKEYRKTVGQGARRHKTNQDSIVVRENPVELDSRTEAGTALTAILGTLLALYYLSVLFTDNTVFLAAKE